MYFPDLAALAAADETTALLLLLWAELFDEASPDTFQPKLRDLPSLVEELHEVSRLAAKSAAWSKHLKEIKDEMVQLLKTEASLLTAFPRYHWSLRHLQNVNDALRLELSAKLLMAEAPDFAAYYAGNLRAALQKMPREKGELTLAVNNLASFATRAGSGRENLRALVEDGMFGLAAADAADALSRGCFFPEADYLFIVPMEADASHLQSVLRNLAELRLLRRDEQPTGTVAETFFQTHAGVRFIQGSTRARGPVAAARAALRQVRPLADLFNFYSNRLFLSLRPEMLLSDQTGRCERVSLAEQSLQRLQPRNRARELSQAAMERPLRDRLEGRLSNAIELYSLALASTSTRVRLVNLWSAVECLLGNLPEGSIIERAAGLFAPLMAWRRVEKVVRYLAICLHEYRDRYSLPLPYTNGFTNSSRDSVRVEDMLHVLAKPMGHAHPAALDAYVNRHVLLRYRLFRAWQALSAPLTLNRELADSEQRVRWQLFRIYRARNLAVHHGDDAPLASPMLDTLQYYLSVVLTRIVKELSTHAVWQLDDAITSLLREAAYVREQLVKPQGVLSTNDLISEPRCRVGELLWP